MIHLTIISDSSILDEEEVQFLLDLLPKFDERTPDVFIVDRWKSIAELTGKQSDLYDRYTIMKKIVRQRLFLLIIMNITSFLFIFLTCRTWILS